VIAAANNGEVLVHCRVAPSGELSLFLKSSKPDLLALLEQSLALLTQQQA